MSLSNTVTAEPLAVVLMTLPQLVDVLSTELTVSENVNTIEVAVPSAPCRHSTPGVPGSDLKFGPRRCGLRMSRAAGLMLLRDRHNPPTRDKLTNTCGSACGRLHQSRVASAAALCFSFRATTSIFEALALPQSCR